MSVEILLARLTAQSTGSDPKQPTGGKPEFNAGDISLIASQAPHMSFHALMTKCCHDPISADRLYIWLHNASLTEWFLNPRIAHASIVVNQVNRLVVLSLIGWALPNAKETATIDNMAAYIHSGFDTYKRKYQAHYSFLTGELDFLEKVGSRAINGFNQRDS